MNHWKADRALKEILVVDDSPNSLRFLNSILTKNGYRVRPASDGAIALRSVAAKPPDLVLLDVKMPDIDGYEVCRRLKSGENRLKAPIIFISGLGETIDKVEGFKAGGVDYVTKPFDAEEILARVNTHLSLYELSERLEEKVRETETLHRVVVENISETIVITNDTGEFTFMHDNMSRVLGYSTEEFRALGNISKIFGNDLFIPEELEAKGELHNIETAIRDRRGNEHTFLVTVKRVDIKGGTVLYTCRDISGRKRTEAFLRESEARLKALFNSVSEAIIVADKRRHVIMINPAAVRMFGYTPDELKNKTTEIFYVDRTGFEEQGRLRYHTGKKANPQIFETEYRRKDGTIFPCESLGTRIVDDEGNILGFVGIHRDITERRLAEERIKNQNVRLEQAVLEKQREMETLFDKLLRQEKLVTIGRMAGSMAHELRNPLGAARNSVYYLKRLCQKGQLESGNPKVGKHLSVIESELAASESVISDALEMTRMNPVRIHQNNLRIFLENVVPYCNLPSRIGTTLDLSPDPFFILADPIQLRQLFVNLLTNAAHSIDDEGRITIRARRMNDENAVKVQIIDTGIGIEPNVLNSVFEPLFTTKAAGTGLGLSVCKEIMEKHKGRIKIESEFGRGTTVELVLPGET